MATQSHPYNIKYFKNNRPEQYDFVNNKIIPFIEKILKNKEYMNTKNTGIVNAPVKSGKRSFPEICSLLTNTLNDLLQPDKSIKHIFITKYYRVCDLDQFEELKQYGIEVYEIKTKKDKDKSIDNIKKLQIYHKIIVHIDELDYGANKDQLLSKIYNNNELNINCFILYSATGEIAKKQFCKQKNNDNEYLVEFPKFEPNESYYSIKNFIDDNKVIEASDFFKIKHEDNGNDIICDFSEQGYIAIGKINGRGNRNIGVLRLNDIIKLEKEIIIKKNKFKQISKFALLINSYFKNNNFKKICDNQKIQFRFSGEQPKIIEDSVWKKAHYFDVNWSDKNFWDSSFSQEQGSKYIIVINDTAGRSTEWKCHHKLAFYHCKRTKSTSISTQIQSQERIVRYFNGEDDNNIILYGNINIAKYSAGYISTQEIIKIERKRQISKDLKLKNSSGLKILHYKFDSWKEIEDIKKKGKLTEKEQKQLINNQKEQLKLYPYLKNLNKKTYIDDSTRLRNQMKTINSKIKDDTKYNIKIGKDDTKYINFYTSNLRDDRNDYIKSGGGVGKIPILFENELDNVKNIGINNKTKHRLRVYYNKNETNPDNYKLILSYTTGEHENIFKSTNHSMYN